MHNKYLIVVLGATAVGKTKFAIELAQRLNTEIISADARQCYMQINIGTAKPTEEEKRGIKHHLLDCIPLDVNYNANRFEKDALTIISELFEKHKYVIMSGGSGLYVDAVCNGLSNIPSVNPAIRDQLYHKYEMSGLGSLLVDLLKLDPDYYKIVDKDNHRRVIRALEVCIGTGVPYTNFLKVQAVIRPFGIIKIGLHLDRKYLYERIDKRVDNMISSGLIEEAISVYNHRKFTSLDTIGYTELFRYIDGEYTLDKAIELIKRNSRRYAKRQITWLNRYSDIHWVKGESIDEVMDIILNTK